MRLARTRSSVAAFFSVAVFVAGTPAAASAQDGPPASSRSPDFYFGQPLGSIGVRGSWVFARAGSDIFSFLTSHLTLDKGDFRARGFATDLAVALTPRVDVVGGFELARSSSRSEYRDFVDNDRLPIEQTTSLRTVHLTGTLRYALVPRGEAVGRLAWVPRRVVPWVGAGAGACWYKLRQTGDFVDFVDLSVFSDSFDSSGWSPSAHGVAGVDLQLHRRLFATVEARYVRSSATLENDFIDFEPIDLSGLRTSAGINFRF